MPIQSKSDIIYYQKISILNTVKRISSIGEAQETILNFKDHQGRAYKADAIREVLTQKHRHSFTSDQIAMLHTVLHIKNVGKVKEYALKIVEQTKDDDGNILYKKVSPSQKNTYFINSKDPAIYIRKVDLTQNELREAEGKQETIAIEYFINQISNYFLPNRSAKVRLHKETTDTDPKITILLKTLSGFKTVKDDPDTYFKYMRDNKEDFVREFGEFFATNLLVGGYFASNNLGIITGSDGVKHLAKALSYSKISYSITSENNEPKADNIKEDMMKLQVSSEDHRFLYPEELWHNVDFIIGINNVVTKVKYLENILTYSLKNVQQAWKTQHFQEKYGIDLNSIKKIIINNIKHLQESLEDFSQEEVRLIIQKATYYNDKDIITRLYLEAPEVMQKYISSIDVDKNNVENIEVINEQITNIINQIENLNLAPTINNQVEEKRDTDQNEEDYCIIDSDYEDENIDINSSLSTKTINTVPPGYGEILQDLEQLLIFESESKGFVRRKPDLNEILKHLPHEELLALTNALIEDPDLNPSLNTKLDNVFDRNYLYEQINKILENRYFTLSKQDLHKFKQNYEQNLYKALSNFHLIGYNRYLKDTKEASGNFLKNIDLLEADNNDILTIIKIITKLKNLPENDLKYLSFCLMTAQQNSLNIQGYSASEILKNPDIIFKNNVDNILNILLLRLLHREPISYKDIQNFKAIAQNSEIDKLAENSENELVISNFQGVQKNVDLLRSNQGLKVIVGKDISKIFNYIPLETLQLLAFLLTNIPSSWSPFNILSHNTRESIKYVDIVKYDREKIYSLIDRIMTKENYILSKETLSITINTVFDNIAGDFKTLRDSISSFGANILSSGYVMLMITKASGCITDNIGIPLSYNSFYDIAGHASFKGKVNERIKNLSLELEIKKLLYKKLTISTLIECFDAPSSTCMPGGSTMRLQMILDLAKEGNYVVDLRKVNLGLVDFDKLKDQNAQLIKAKVTPEQENTYFSESLIKLKYPDLFKTVIENDANNLVNLLNEAYYENVSTGSKTINLLLKHAFIQKNYKIIESLITLKKINFIRFFSSEFSAEFNQENFENVYSIIHEEIKTLTQQRIKDAQLIACLEKILILLASFGDENALATIKELQNTEINFLAINKDNKNALEIACLAGHFEVVEYLLTLSPSAESHRKLYDINKKTSDKTTLIERVAENVQIIRNQNYVDISNSLKKTNAELTQEQIDIKIAEILNDNNIKKKNYIKILTSLKEAGAKLNIEIAVIIHDKEYINELLKICKFKETILNKYTIKNEEWNDVTSWTIDKIKELQATKEATSLNGLYLKIINTVLILSFKYEWVTQAKEILDPAGININIPSNNVMEPIDSAYILENEESPNLIIYPRKNLDTDSIDIDINIRSNDLMRPIDWACTLGNEELLNLIIYHKKFSISQLDETLKGSSYTPPYPFTSSSNAQTKAVPPPAILIALLNKHIKIVKELISKANPDIWYGEKTILHHLMENLDLSKEENVDIIIRLQTKSKNIPDIDGNHILSRENIHIKLKEFIEKKQIIALDIIDEESCIRNQDELCLERLLASGANAFDAAHQTVQQHVIKDDQLSNHNLVDETPVYKSILYKLKAVANHFSSALNNENILETTSIEIEAKGGGKKILIPFTPYNFIESDRMILEIPVINLNKLLSLTFRSSFSNSNNEQPSGDNSPNYPPLEQLLVGTFIAKETIESLPIIKSFLNIYKIDTSWLSYNSFWSNAHLVATYASSIIVGSFDPSIAMIVNNVYAAKQNLKEELLEAYNQANHEVINNPFDFIEKCGPYIIKQILLGGLTSGSLDIITAYGALNNGLFSGLECYRLYNHPIKHDDNFILYQAAKISYPFIIYNSISNSDLSNSFNVMLSFKKMIFTLNNIVITDSLLGETNQLLAGVISAE